MDLTTYFDFSKEFKEIDSFIINAETGITASNPTIVDLNKITIRIAGGSANTRYPVTVSATTPNGEKRDMTVIFLMQ